MTGTTTTHTLLERNYRLFTPDGIAANAPLVISLHPFGDAETWQTDVSQLNNELDDVAFSHSPKFYVAYPNGTGRYGVNQYLSWNCGWCCGFAYEARKQDILFIRNLITKLTTLYSIDPAKIHLVGFSNGAMLSYSLLATNPTLFASATIFAGALKMDYDSIEGTIAVPITHVWGTADTIVDPEGDVGDETGGPYGAKHASLVDLFAELDSRGATITEVELTGATHSFASIKSVLASQESTTPATLIAGNIV